MNDGLNAFARDYKEEDLRIAVDMLKVASKNDTKILTDLVQVSLDQADLVVKNLKRIMDIANE